MSTAPEFHIVTEPDALQTAVMAWPDRARSITVADDAGEERAAAFLLDIAALQKEVASTFDPIVAKARATWQEAIAQRTRHAAPLEEADTIIRRSLNTYREEKRRVAELERRRIEDERRKLEEDARLAEAQAAQDAGDVVTAEQIIAAPIHVAPAPRQVSKPAGVAYVTRWNAEVVDLLALVRHVAAHPEDLNLLTPNATAIRQLVTARKAGTNLPGVKVWSTEEVAARGRR